MSKRDYYEVLGVSRTCGEAELKAAFRKLAMQHHPDRNPGDTDCEHKFKELNEAYDVLKDGDKRAAYDRFGHAAFEHGGRAAARTASAPISPRPSPTFSKTCSAWAAAGAAAARQGRERGSDLRYNMEISLEEAYAGQDRADPHPDLGDLRSLLRHRRQGRHASRSLRDLRRRRQDPARAGLLHARAHLPGLPGPRPGRSTIPARPAPAPGRVTRERTLSVNIPPGVEDGTRIRLAGEGEAGLRGGPAGDLYIFLSLAPHEFFQRDGADLHCRVPISMVTAALGGEFEVPAIDGSKARVKVPAGTQTGRRFRLSGKGMPVLRSKQTGDMYVQVVVETPQNLTKRQRELLAEFEKLSSEATQPESAGFFSRVKEFLDGLGNRGSHTE